MTPDRLERAREAAMEKAATTSGHMAGCYGIAAEAIQAFLSELGKEGMVIVPRNPTLAMKAMGSAWCGGSQDMSHEAWRVMIAAALSGEG